MGDYRKGFIDGYKECENTFKEMIEKIKEEISMVFYNCKDELGMTSLIIDKYTSQLNSKERKQDEQ